MNKEYTSAYDVLMNSVMTLDLWNSLSPEEKAGRRDEYDAMKARDAT